jgi:hypothetical protein
MLLAYERPICASTAELVALAEDCRALAMQEGPGGAGAISALVRLESSSARAVRALRLPAANAAAPMDLNDHAAKRALERANPQRPEGSD